MSKFRNVEDNDECIFELQRKLKSLKEAFRKEREARESAERQLVELKDVVVNQENAIKDKVSA